MSKFIVLILISSAIIIACDKNEITTCNNDQKLKNLTDSTLERHKQALKVINNYPLDEWGRNILNRIEAVVGSEVAQELREQTKNSLKDKDILEMRLSLLTEVYNANELAMLSELYSKDEGKSLLNKVSIHDDRLRELIMPALSKVLSSAPPNK
jgi:hypothetical protein